MSRFHVPGCLLLGLVLLAAPAMAAESADDDDVHELRGKESIRFIGRSPAFEWSSSSGANDSARFLRLEFGKMVEITAQGQPVQHHAIESLAARKPHYTTGVAASADGQNVSYVRMHLPLSNVTGLSPSTCPGGSSPLVSAEEFAADASVTITVFLAIPENATFQFGLNNTVAPAANSTKFNIEATNWPFCSINNSLSVAMELRTNAGDHAHPKATNSSSDDSGNDDAGAYAGDDSGGNTTVATSGSHGTESESTSSHSLRLLLAGQANARRPDSPGLSPPGGSHGGQDDRNGSNSGGGGGGGGGHGSGNSSGRPHRQDPRVKGARRDRVAMFTGNGTAALLDLESYAFDAENGTTLFNVSCDVEADGESTRVLLTFPAFRTLFYDPTASFDVDATEAGFTAAEVAAYSTTTAATAAAVKSSGGPRAAARAGGLAVVGAAALLIAGLL